jgi:hypothetical protein
MKYRLDGWIVFAALAAITTPNCNDDGPYWDGEDADLHCRGLPGDCAGDIGGFCRFDEDCGRGVCCGTRECGSGMCTYFCDIHADCPRQMLCEDGYCFFGCHNDGDCASDQDCKHGETVCQY